MENVQTQIGLSLLLNNEWVSKQFDKYMRKIENETWAATTTAATAMAGNNNNSRDNV